MLYVKGKLVGMKNNVAEIESWLQDHQSPNSTVLLIHGMGGIGKSTIARSVFDSNCHEYEGSCFLANVNEESNQPKGLLWLQTQLLSKILKRGKKETIWDVKEGTTKVIKAISSKRILLVLDDVATSKQLDALLGPKTFHPGSKVIITTRDKSLINPYEVNYKLQTITALSNDDSIKLFSLHAFHQDQPIESYDVHSKLVIHHCMGLPLALEVLGSYLRGKNIKEWEDAWCQLQKSPHPRIQDVLELSYKNLEFQNDKDLFLHIACFFVWEDEDFILKLLTECNLHPTVGIRNLVDRCLIYVKGKQLGMHQLIREMGQEVVLQESPKDPGKRTRLWRHEDCIKVLKDNEDSCLICKRPGKLTQLYLQYMDNYSRKRSFEVYQRKTIYDNEVNFKIGALEKMKKLMLLQLNYVTFSGECNSLPKKLRLLRWHGFPLKCIPGNIPLEMLVLLDMSYSKLERVWDDIKFIRSLKVLNLSYCDELMKTPDFRGLPGLESLILKGCKRLPKVDESVACLNELVLLDLTDCLSLREFPRLPASLVSLEMSGCPNLGAVGGFRSLDLTSLPGLLRRLNISYCNLFDNSFPDDWSNLVSLEKLCINHNHVTALPNCIQSLPALGYLEASDCSQIQSIIGLPRTVALHCFGNESLEKIQLTNYLSMGIDFVGLHIIECPKLWEVEGLYKYRSIDKVEKKIIEKLWLGSSMELGTLDYSKQKVLYENGIFSTFVTQNQIPSCSSYKYKGTGPKISFRVPWKFNDSRVITSFNMCLVFREYMHAYMLGIEVYNKTKDLRWIYTFGTFHGPSHPEKLGWLSLWRCGNLLDDGDEICVRILDMTIGNKVVEVEECGINLIDEEDNKEQHDDEECNQVVVSACDGMAWSDRMLHEISDCVDNGSIYEFGDHWELIIPLCF